LVLASSRLLLALAAHLCGPVGLGILALLSLSPASRLLIFTEPEGLQARRWRSRRRAPDTHPDIQMY
jgi:hypothetical protein